MKSFRIVLEDSELTSKELEIKYEFEQLSADCRADRRANIYAGPLEKYLQRYYIKKISKQDNPNLPKRYIQYLKNHGITFSPIYKNPDSQRYTSVELIRDRDGKIICEYKSKTKYRPRASKKPGNILLSHHEIFEARGAFTAANIELSQQEMITSRLLTEEELTVNEKKIINQFTDIIKKFRENRGHLSLGKYIEKYFPNFKKDLEVEEITYRALKNNPTSRQATKVQLIRNSDKNILFEYAMGNSNKNAKKDINESGSGIQQTKKSDPKKQNQKISKLSKPDSRVLIRRGRGRKAKSSTKTKNIKMKASSKKTEGRHTTNKKTFFNIFDNDELMMQAQSVRMV